MKMLLYPKLAFTSIKKNQRLYVPYMIAAAFVVMTFYITYFLSTTDKFSKMRGGYALNMTMHLGTFVMFIFSAIFLFYTNSFLIKMRKKEWGLYNILGMSKQNVIKVVWWETVVMALISIIVGLITGIVFSKLAELGLAKLTGIPADYSMEVSWNGIIVTIAYYIAIFAVLFCFGIFAIIKSRPTELLHGTQVGEKAPKANWFLGLSGFIILAVAYYIAVTITNPISALVWFFQAVIMVIVATYLLFIAGSVLVCKILQKNKNYYYKPSHFVSVSSMAYRMKRNGAGLATICILLTMILVMIASSACLYKGAEETLDEQFPRELNLYAARRGYQETDADNFKSMINSVDEYALNNGIEFENTMALRRYEIDALMEGSELKDLDYSTIISFDVDYSKICTLEFVDVNDYNAVYGSNYKLNDGEALYKVARYKLNEAKELSVGGLNFKLTDAIKEYAISDEVTMSIGAKIVLIVNDLDKVMADFARNYGENEHSMIYCRYTYDVDIKGVDGEDTDVYIYPLAGAFSEGCFDDTSNYVAFECLSRSANAADFYGMYGALFFVGIILSLVFMIACVLIIYYKQITEGYEDKARFEIMQKVGMTKGDIKKSINSQMFTVFFMPILAAVIHLSFAFPMIFKLLMLFGLSNIKLFLLVASVVAVIIAVCYSISYKLTTNVYLNIVSEAK